MTDRPIIFNAPMVRAILDGRKSQTRRVLKNQATWDRVGEKILRMYPHQKADVPYAVGDRLWVREPAWICPPGWTNFVPRNPRGPDRRDVVYKADDKGGGTAETAADYKLALTPSVQLPHWASRLTLIVTDVRVQLVQDISEEDAAAEGCPGWYSPRHPDDGVTDGRLPHEEFGELWNSINAKRGFGWDANPWVVAVTFTTIKANIDRLAELTEGATT